MSDSMLSGVSVNGLPLFAGSGSASKDKKVHEAAQQFEALMVGEMLKTARETGSEGWFGSGDSSTDDTALSMAESQLSNALAKNGGLGLAGVIERALSPKTGAAQNAVESVGSVNLSSVPKT